MQDVKNNKPANEPDAQQTAQEDERADDAALAEEAERLKQDLADAQEQLLRRAAEFQNYRRRTEEEKRLMVDIGKGAVIERLLDVVDDFARMLDVADQTASNADSLRTGVEMIYRKLMEELRKLGVEPIEATGQPFDENAHEAVMRQPAPEGTMPGTVLQEVQRGYQMNDRVLRHARVIVASDEA